MSGDRPLKLGGIGTNRRHWHSREGSVGSA
jgi:hypothetical protein